MKINANEIKPGMIIEHKNDYWNVLKTQHVKPGKGGAFNQVELKSVIKGTKLNERFRSSETVEKAEVDEKEFNFLYIDGDNCHFMDNQTFEQVSVVDNIIGKNINFLKDGMNVDLLFDGSEILDIRLPAHVNLKVVETEPGIKGNTATGATKPAKVETGYLVQVPLFVAEGNILKIDTRTGEYIERLKS